MENDEHRRQPQATPQARAHVARLHADVVREVADAVGREPLVVVGMAQNPHVKRVLTALAEAGHRPVVLSYGSYFSGWSRRLAIKLWSGWPTFPQVFARGVLIGGEDLTIAAIQDGSLERRLAKTGPD